MTVYLKKKNMYVLKCIMIVSTATDTFLNVI